MKAVTWHGVGDLRFGDVPDPRLEQPTDAIVRITTSAICGTDLHLVRGTLGGLTPGLILGHEAVGEVVEVGEGVRNFAPGDRVVIPSTIACGYCSYCRAGYFAQCDNANPNGKRAGTAIFGGPASTGGFNGLQAELARVPYANVGLVALPPEVSDDQAVMLSDILPTAWFGAHLAEVHPGDVVAVFGCGPVGQLAILSAYLRGAGRVIAVDSVPDRLALAKGQHAEVVDFTSEDPVAAIVDMTGGVGADRAIDAVGVDASRGPRGDAEQFDEELSRIAPETSAGWPPGDGPTQAARWSVDAVAKAGTIGVIGVYPQTVDAYPFGMAMNKNLTIKTGNCHHRKYIPELLELVVSGAVDPSQLLTRHEPMVDVLDAYREFNDRHTGWLKVALTV